MKSALRLLASLLIAAPLAAPADSGREATPRHELDNAGLQRMVEQGALVIDIRRPEEWRQTGVIEGSYLVTAFDEYGRVTPEFAQLFGALTDPERPVVLICRTGNRTDFLARMLVEQAGYQRVYNVTDGITSWISAGGDVKPCTARGPDLRC